VKHRRHRGLAAVALAAGWLVPALAVASPASAPVRSPEANEIDVEEHLSEPLERGLSFRDHEGAAVTLGDYFDGERPVLLTLNYYRCPVLCNIQLNALTESLARLSWTPGDENFRVVTVSIDPREGPELAAHKRASHLEALGKGENVDWAFLTGDAAQIRLLAAQVGIGYAYDNEQDQYAHPPVIVFLSPDGKVMRYLYGLTYEPRDLQFGLIEAAQGRVGSTMDQLILSCFHYDASIGKYGPFAFGIMRVGGALTVIGIGIFLGVWWRRDRLRSEREKHELGLRAEGAEVLS
jgi:protein SCO1/2